MTKRLLIHTEPIAPAGVFVEAALLVALVLNLVEVGLAGQLKPDDVAGISILPREGCLGQILSVFIEAHHANIVVVGEEAHHLPTIPPSAGLSSLSEVHAVSTAIVISSVIVAAAIIIFLIVVNVYFLFINSSNRLTVSL